MRKKISRNWHRKLEKEVYDFPTLERYKEILQEMNECEKRLVEIDIERVESEIKELKNKLNNLTTEEN